MGDMTEPERPVPKPSRVREPSCIHHRPGTPDNEKQPASACRICQHGPQLQQWKDEWAVIRRLPVRCGQPTRSVRRLGGRRVRRASGRFRASCRATSARNGGIDD